MSCRAPEARRGAHLWWFALALLIFARPVAASGLSPLEDEYFEGWFSFHPQEATRLGVHRYDDRLLPVTAASVAAEAAWLHDFSRRLAALPVAKLDYDDRIDRAALGARVDRQLLELEEVRGWEHNPNFYVNLVTSPVLALLQRNFASPCTRIRSAARRLRAVPEVLRGAEVNLKHPPRLFTEVAIEQTRGALRFYRETVPALSADCREPELQAALAEADTLAVRATESFLRFLQDGLLPHSDGQVPLGRDLYQRKLWADERDSTPVDSLLARGWRELNRTRARMTELAARVAPGASVEAVLDTLARDHPSADQQITFVSAVLDTIRAFVRDRDLLTPPRHEHLIVRETPTFARSLSFASMDSPGVWESGADEAYFNVTPVDRSWSEAQQQDHLGFFNRWNTQIVSIHEALPGHYYQFMALRGVKSRVRASLGCGTNIEGWAHYCEQMAVEQGYGGGDPRIEIEQQWAALQRLGRLVAGLSIHTAGMTQEQAEELFEEQCWMKPINAAREARRGALDPTYLVYTLGKWHILDLREEVRAALGDRYSPKVFHDALLRQGVVPLPLVRCGVLHELAGRDLAPEDAGR
ncbi:MAG: DUF885 domain-containing protein [Candidatus Eiseniibacteriota bacterium]